MEEAPTCYCNNCETSLGEEDLEALICIIDGEPCRGCPNCETDAYLIDL